jgi:hypothetical protein
MNHGIAAEEGYSREHVDGTAQRRDLAPAFAVILGFWTGIPARPDRDATFRNARESRPAHTTSATFAKRYSSRRRVLPLRINYLSLLSVASILIFLPTARAKGVESVSRYDQVFAALQTGKPVEVLIDLSRCAVTKGNGRGPSVQGGLRISNFIVSSQGISFSDVHQTLDASNHPVTEYIRYRLDREGNVTVRIAKLAAAADEAVGQGEYACAQPEGVRFLF